MRHTAQLSTTACKPARQAPPRSVGLPQRPRHACHAAAPSSVSAELDSAVRTESSGAAPGGDRRREELKAQLRAAAGPRNGLDRTEAQRAAIRELVTELEALNPSSEPAGERFDINCDWVRC